MNFLGAFTSTAVAKTVGDGLINTDPGRVTAHLILAALIGAIVWNLFTWYLGLPSSSSHALVGGLVGAALAAGGPDPVHWGGIWNKVVWPGLASPVIGFVLAGALMVAILWVFRRVLQGPLNRGVPACAGRARAASWRSPMGRTTPRRRWASSRSPSTPRATRARRPTSPTG